MENGNKDEKKEWRDWGCLSSIVMIRDFYRTLNGFSLVARNIDEAHALAGVLKDYCQVLEVLDVSGKVVDLAGRFRMSEWEAKDAARAAVDRYMDEWEERNA